MKGLPDKNSKLEDYEIFADVDLIITDLDGTLIKGSEPVLGQIKKCINYLRRKKTQITIATGRTYFGAKSLMDDIEIKLGMPITLYNGGIVLEYGTNNVLFASLIPGEIVEDIKQILDLNRTVFYLYTFSISDNGLQGNSDTFIQEDVYAYGNGTNKKDINERDIIWLDQNYKFDLPPTAILIEKEKLSVKEKEKIILFLESNEKVSFTDSGNGFIEIKGCGLDKGIIFDILKAQPRYKINKILAIGDNDNDKELFQCADISVAVANSSELAIENADYICEHESAWGFLDMLNVLKTAKKYYIDKRNIYE
ncbi:MAG TPA: HAD-IIB family hydrolase [Clostridiales bacterium]|nr:HAD-IIB family hydrolase [Clostridiales bacterium]